MERVLRELKKLAAMQEKLTGKPMGRNIGRARICADCDATIFVGQIQSPLDERCSFCKRILLDNEARLIRWVGAEAIPEFP